MIRPQPAPDALRLTGPSGPALAGLRSEASGPEPSWALDRWHAGLQASAAALAQRAEGAAGQGPWGQLVQFGVGAASGLLALPEGLYQALRHPWQALSAMGAMLTHLPLLSPLWWGLALREGPVVALQRSAEFWTHFGQAWLAPFQAEWAQGRHAALAGRVVVELALLLVGARQLKAAVEGRRVTKARLLAPQVGTAEALPRPLQAQGARLTAPPARRSVGLGPGKAPTPRARGQGRVQGLNRRAAFQHARQAGLPRARRVPEELAALRRQGQSFRSLRMVGPERLLQDPSLQGRYRRFVHALDRRLDAQLEALLGHQPQGLPKRADRAAQKLALWREAKEAPNLRLGSLDDLARGRVDLPRFDPAEIRRLADRVVQHFGPDRIKVNDYLEGSAFYRGRLHLKIKDATGAWYELQLGPKQLSQFYEAPLEVAGRASNVHDLVYKGLMRLEPGALRHLGGGDLAKGQAMMDRAMRSYQEALAGTLQAAAQGAELPVGHTMKLHRELELTLGQLPEALLPEALRG